MLQISYRLFGTKYHLHGSSIPRKILELLEPVRWGRIPKLGPVTANYTLRDIPDKRRSHLHRGGKLNSCLFTNYLIKRIKIPNNWTIPHVFSSIILRLLGRNDGFETSFGHVRLVACFFVLFLFCSL